jgi:arylsulfatase A-like enzyme
VRAAAAALALATALGCAESPLPSRPAAPPRPAPRLRPDLGPPTLVRFRDETRPAVLLRPGEERSSLADAEPGSRLSFVWAIGPRSPDQGYVELKVTAGAETVYRRQVATGRRRRWWPVSIPVSGQGLKITIRGDHVHAGGRAVAAPGDAAPPWIVIASPRIDPPRTEPGRVLVWISQDAVRADHLSAYGYRRATTPRFDRRSPAWVVFDDAVATSSWTLPSLGSQFTSRYPLFHGATSAQRRRDERHPTVFESLASAGFTVLGVTANDFVSSYFGLAHGFDALRFTGGTEGPEGRQRAEDLNRLAIAALEEWRGGDLALFVHYMDPHHPYDPPPPFDRLFPVDAGTGAGRGDRARARMEAAYDGEIAYTDTQIDALLEELERRNLLRDAVVVYTADHGEEFLDHGGWKHSRTVYREMLHIPLALRLPGVAGRRVAETVSLIDLAPTVLEALAVGAPASFQGRSLLPLARGQGLPAREIYAETERTTDGSRRLAVQLGSVKYVRTLYKDAEKPPGEELYDLAADPREERSTLDHPDAERLRRYATAYLARAADEAPKAATVDVPPEVRARLRALGYVD